MYVDTICDGVEDPIVVVVLLLKYLWVWVWTKSPVIASLFICLSFWFMFVIAQPSGLCFLPFV